MKRASPSRFSGLVPAPWWAKWLCCGVWPAMRWQPPCLPSSGCCLRKIFCRFWANSLRSTPVFRPRASKSCLRPLRLAAGLNCPVAQVCVIGLQTRWRRPVVSNRSCWFLQAPTAFPREGQPGWLVLTTLRILSLAARFKGQWSLRCGVSCPAGCWPSHHRGPWCGSLPPWWLMPIRLTIRLRPAPCLSPNGWKARVQSWRFTSKPMRWRIGMAVSATTAPSPIWAERGRLTSHWPVCGCWRGTLTCHSAVMCCAASWPINCSVKMRAALP